MIIPYSIPVYHTTFFRKFCIEGKIFPSDILQAIKIVLFTLKIAIRSHQNPTNLLILNAFLSQPKVAQRSH
jgi:hypothetical protein